MACLAAAPPGAKVGEGKCGARCEGGRRARSARLVRSPLAQAGDSAGYQAVRGAHAQAAKLARLPSGTLDRNEELSAAGRLGEVLGDIFQDGQLKIRTDHLVSPARV